MGTRHTRGAQICRQTPVYINKNSTEIILSLKFQIQNTELTWEPTSYEEQLKYLCLNISQFHFKAMWAYEKSLFSSFKFPEIVRFRRKGNIKIEGVKRWVFIIIIIIILHLKE